MMLTKCIFKLVSFSRIENSARFRFPRKEENTTPPVNNNSTPSTITATVQGHLPSIMLARHARQLAFAPLARVPAGWIPAHSRALSSPTASRATASSAASSGGNAGNANPPPPRSIGTPAAMGLAGACLTAGYAAGFAAAATPPTGSDGSGAPAHVLPDGLPRSCCSCEAPASAGAPSATAKPLTEMQRSLPSELASIVGSANVLPGSVESSASGQYLRGARLGGGSALAVVRPQSLQQAVQCLQVIVDADCTVIPQGANTGLTGGSVPRGDCDMEDPARPAVVLSMRSLDAAFPIDGGDRVVCLAGTGIADLSRKVSEWFPGRESHSVLGSTFLNPTVAAGVAFGSGGTQLRKGPAMTNRAMYAKVDRDKWGANVITVVNTLGIDGIEDSDFLPGKGSAIEQLDVYARDVKGGYSRAMANSSDSRHGTASASAGEYSSKVCQNEDSVSRSNADTAGEDCNRSEGKVLILATVHDTFPKAERPRTFWVSFADFDTALAFRREVCLDNPADLPISVEYMDRDSFDVIDTSSRVSANLIKILGAGAILGKLWQAKLWIESLPFDGAPLFCDKVLYALNGFAPAILPSRMMEAGRAMDHHVAMTVGEFGGGTLDRVVDRMEVFVEQRGVDKVRMFECQSRSEEASLMAFRFIAAPAFRTWCVGNGKQGVSIDYALPKNGGKIPALGEGISQPKPVKRMRYSHFGCNVVHEDLAYDAGVDVHTAKMALKKSVENECNGKLPAEHGHGTEYHAPEETQKRWMRMDPLNALNPGIGGLSSKYKYKD